MSNVRNISVDQSANTRIDINVTDTTGAIVDLTLYTAGACYKKHMDSANTGAITATGYANGMLRLTLSAVETANITHGRYVYEAYVNHTSSNTTTRVQEGIMTVKGSPC
jgi:hypothetical protein